MFARTVATGGAAICLGAAYELSTPNADALSILLPGPSVNGVGTTTRINILEGNIFNPQLGIVGGSTSNNTTVGNVAMGLGNNIINQLLSAQINLGGTAGNGNTTQINILSYNIFNPQISLGPNVSNNTTVNNVAMGNGNNSTSDVTTTGGLLPWLGGAAGNGNTAQLSFLSGNIFNPQWSLLGQNLSHNTAITNVAIGNGNYSATTVALGGWFGAFLFGGGNGNTLQFGYFVSNIYNPQFSWGAGNISNNTAATNTASDNGNNSTNDVTGGGLGTGVGGIIGNGNSTQVSTGSGNIFNDQINVGPFGGTGTGISTVTTVSSTPGESTIQQLVLDSSTAGGADVASGSSTAAVSTTTDPDPNVVSTDGSDTSEHRNVQASTTSREPDDESTTLNDSAPDTTDDTSGAGQADSGIDSADGGDGGGDGEGGGDSGGEGGGDSGGDGGA